MSPYRQFTRCHCDRCGQSSDFDDIAHAQRNGWQTLQILKIGASLDGTPVRRDLCSDCVEAFSVWYIAPKTVPDDA